MFYSSKSVRNIFSVICFSMGFCAWSEARADLQITPNLISFQEIQVGTRSFQSVEILNESNQSLINLQVTLVGDSSTFIVNSTDCDSVPPNGYCSIAIGFAPPTAGDFQASLEIGGMSLANEVQISGSAVAPPSPNKN